MTHAERQRALVKRWLEAGKCQSCGKSRIEEGATKLRCAKCAELQRIAQRNRESKRKIPRKDPRTAPAKWVKRVPKHGEMIWNEEMKRVVICSTLVNNNVWVLIPRIKYDKIPTKTKING